MRRIPKGPKGEAVLKDTGELLDVFRDVCANDPIRGLDVDCDQDRLRWIAAAEHALKKADRCAVGMFTKIVKQGLWSNLTEAADESARRRLSEYDRQQRGYEKR